MLKYQGTYQICQEYYCDIKTKQYGFSDNDNATYIVLKNNGSIYRFNKDTLVLNLSYRTPIGSNSTKIKSPLKELYEELNDKINILDKDFFDDCIQIRFKESDLDIIMDILGEKHGTYMSRSNRYYKSRINLPDFKFRKKELKDVKNKKMYNKLNKSIKETSKRIGKNEQSVWKILHGRLRKRLDLPMGVGQIANQEGVSSINIIDSQNWYELCFDILEKM